MGLLDEALGNALPGGSSLTKPLMIAVGSLLLGKMLSGGGSQPAPPKTTQAAPPKTTQAGAGDDGDVGGLGGLLHKLEKAGEGKTVKSWVGKGQNAPLDPGKLGQALGDKTVGNLAQQTGINSQDLLSQLSKVLPGVIDQLTPHGKVPSQQEVASRIGQGQQ